MTPLINCGLAEQVCDSSDRLGFQFHTSGQRKPFCVMSHECKAPHVASLIPWKNERVPNKHRRIWDTVKTLEQR
jgi:hypothetical protein